MLPSILAFAAALVPLLLLIAWLERRSERREKERALAELAEARSRGSDRPLAQHPQIDALRCVGCGLCVRACPEDEVLAVIDGVARVVHGSRCVGHGLCAEACPVGAITIGLGALAGREDLPLLAATQESSVPGLFVVGELSGIALIRHAIRQGVAAVDEIARRSSPRAGARAPAHPACHGDERFDVAIVGAGPAGLAASLRAIECRLSHVLLEQDELGGTILHYPRQKLVMTQPVELPLLGRLKRSEYAKEELVALFEQARTRFPLNVRSSTRVEAVRRDDDGFRIETSRGELRARHVVLALGRRGTPRRLEVPGEELPKVSYRLIDAALYRGQRLLVVGGGDSAVEAALGLAGQPGNRVTLSYRKENFFRLKRRNEERIEAARAQGRVEVRFGSRVVEITSDSVRLAVAEGAGERELDLGNDFVFVFAGGSPPFPLLRDAGVQFPQAAAAAPA